MPSNLSVDRKANLRSALAVAPFDGFLAMSAANVQYATGYRSLGGAVHGASSIGCFVTGERCVVAGPVADSGPATEEAIAADDFVPYGRFYFESDDGRTAAAAYAVDSCPSLVAALAAAARQAGLESSVVGVDVAAISPAALAQLELALPRARFVDASGWALRVRSRKLPGERDLLEHAARLAEDGVSAAIGVAKVGMTERELAAVVAETMARGGGEPRFVVVTSGPRSALADAFPADRALCPGDLVRFDVGCVVDGYWSDIGRTAVVGGPDPVQAKRYQAILAGEEEQLASVRAGVTAAAIFDIAVKTVQARGIEPYHRHHCGHGIGLDVYEPPIISDSTPTEIEAGMTFCFETPYYVLGWGGMMVEDTIIVTRDGHERFTTSDRGLRVIPA